MHCHCQNLAGLNVSYSVGDPESWCVIALWINLAEVVKYGILQESSCVQQVRTLVIDKCQACADEKTRNHFITALDDDNTSVGLLINERFINIPPQIALPLYKSLR